MHASLTGCARQLMKNYRVLWKKGWGDSFRQVSERLELVHAGPG